MSAECSRLSTLQRYHQWYIEDWHRVLKSGCSIDDLAHETAERLRRAIAINLVIAWRISAWKKTPPFFAPGAIFEFVSEY
jgi:hypothetical protein